MALQMEQQPTDGEAPAAGGMAMPQGAAAQPDSADGPAGGGPSGAAPNIFAAYEKLREAKGRMDVIQRVLGGLTTLGDNVTPEDVVEGAGKIVGAGVAPEAMAGMLADMPEKPELIAQWLAGHAQDINQKEQQLGQAMGLVRHHMGAEALRTLAGAAPQDDAAGADNSLALGGQMNG